ncbi:MAG: hypothetical protein ACREON_04085 [Gemmatimonadaceae bacterium]
MSDKGGVSPTERERRKNLALRRLIDEMLAQVRELNRNNGIWTPEERAQAEETLDLIMARVRTQATLPAVERTKVE